MRRVFSGLAMLLVWVQVCAAPVIWGNEDVSSLQGAVDFLADPTARLTIDDVVARAGSKEFVPGTGQVGFLPAGVIWARVTVQRAASSQQAEFWLDLGNRRLPRADLFEVRGGRVAAVQSAGAAMPFDQRPLPTPTLVFPVRVIGDEPVDLYLRLQPTQSGNVDLLPAIWAPRAYLSRAEVEKLGWAAYLGMVFALCGLNTILWIALRDRRYILYVFCAVSLAWAVTSLRGGIGAGFQYLWPTSPTFEQASYVLSILASGVFPAVFVMDLLNVRARFPRVAILWTLLVSLLAISVTVQILPILAPKAMAQHYDFFTGRLAVTVTALTGASVSIVFLLLTGRLAIKGERSAIFVAVAWTPLFAVAAWSAVAGLAGLPPPAAALLLACAFEVVVFSIALADRFVQERREKFVAQRSLVNTLRNSERVLEDTVRRRTVELSAARERAHRLLHNILPKQVAEELERTGRVMPARHENVTVLFTDFTGFTDASAAMPPDRVVSELNDIFAAFDDIADQHGLEKIKTIGDAYMAAAGLPTPCADHAARCVRAGLDMVAWLAKRNGTAAYKWHVRVGIHSGPVIAGVVGKRKYAYDIWGDTVNTAARMESAGIAGRVNLTAYTYDLIRQEFRCEYRGKVAAKGKGDLDMYLVEA